MSDVTMEMENKNLVVENEIVNSDNPEVETVTINDTESENNSDQNQGDTFYQGRHAFGENSRHHPLRVFREGTIA